MKHSKSQMWGYISHLLLSECFENLSKITTVLCYYEGVTNDAERTICVN